jgi:hypothetical protein
MTFPKILIFDLESGAGVNGFKADLSVTLCIGYKWLHEKKAKCLSVLDYGDLKKKRVMDWDVKMLDDFAKVVSEADMIVGHYSKMFDLPYLNGRRLLHGQTPLAPTKHFDTCLNLRGKVAFSSKRLKHLSKILNLKKRKLENNWPEGWIEVARNPKKHIGDMIPYCIGDVLATEELFLRTAPLSKYTGLFHLGRDEITCPKCGSQKLQKRGKLVSVGKTHQRYQCQDCGSWSRDGLSDEKDKRKTRMRDL